MTYYRRRELTDEELWLTGAIGVAVGALAFYLTRIWLQREPLAGQPALTEEPARSEREAEGAERSSR